jgi:hypothetical protein
MKTALQEFLEQIVLKQVNGSVYLLPAITDVQIKKALETEKQNLIDAYDAGAIAWSDAVIDKENTKEWSDQYFNDTYKTVSN